MTKRRRGQLAIIVLEDLFKTRGTGIYPSLGPEVIHRAKKIGASVEELKEFMQFFTRRLIRLHSPALYSPPKGRILAKNARECRAQLTPSLTRVAKAFRKAA